MAENKTVETDASVDAFLDSVPHEGRREDARALRALMERVTGAPARMWGPSIVGFGKYHYRYESGREGEMLRVGFSPRSSNLALYLTSKDEDSARIVARLGKHKAGASCLYVNRLADVDSDALEALIAHSWTLAAERYGAQA
ncbi:MAG: DUF1801 domain-containing protein [Gemmatimonadota bacterium]